MNQSSTVGRRLFFVFALFASACIEKPAPTGVLALLVGPTDVTLTPGTTLALTATTVSSDATRADVTASATWASSSTGVATVSNSGQVTALTPGTVVITATSGTLSAEATLTISEATLMSLSVSPATPMSTVGDHVQLVALGNYSDGSTRDLTGSVTWDSSAPGVASIDSTGLATALGAGLATLTATSGTIHASSPLTVSTATLLSLELSPATVTARVGDRVRLALIGTYSDGTSRDLTTSATWSSSATNVASVTAGLALALASGSSTLTASSGLASATATLTVTSAPLVAITLSPPGAVLAVSGTQQLTATGTFADGTTGVLGSVTWDSSVPGVATVGSSGLVTAVSTGATTVTATSGSVSATVSISVSAQAFGSSGALVVSATTISSGNQVTFTVPPVTGATTCALTLASASTGTGAPSGTLSSACVPTGALTATPACTTAPSCTNRYDLTFGNGVSSSTTSVVVTVFPQPTLTSGTFNLSGTGLSITGGTTGNFVATLPVFAATTAQFRITGVGTAYDSGWNRVTVGMPTTFPIPRPSSTTVYSLTYANAWFQAATQLTCDTTTGCVSVAGGANQTVTVVPPVSFTGSLSGTAVVPAGQSFTLTLPSASASSVTCALSGVPTNGGTAGILPPLNSDCSVGGAHTTSVSLTPTCTASVRCLNVYTLTASNSVGTAAVQTLTVSAVPAPATSGTLSGPVLAVSGAPITLSLPTITNADTVIVQANGVPLPVGNLVGASSVQTAMPATKTVYTLWASNSVTASAQLGAAATVLSASSSSADSLPKAVFGAGAVMLDATTAYSGMVLVVGGINGTLPYTAGLMPSGLREVSLYNPATGLLTTLGANVLATQRAFPSVALLSNGKVLVAGGNAAGSSLFEIIDTTLGSPTATAIGNDFTPRCLSALVGPMSNGRYLLTGGTTCANDTATTGWKTINPLAGAAATVTSGGAGLMGTNPLALARSWHTATKLTGDVVLLAGGRDALVPTTTLELVQYNAANEAVTSFAIASPLLAQARFGHTATRFPAGCVNTCKVLLAGGTGATRFADVYTEPSAGFSTGSIAASSGQMSTARTFASAALLTPGGVVLIAGGSDGVGPLSSTEFFDPASGTFVSGPSMATRRQQLSVAANANTAFIIGGAVSSAGGTPNSAYPTLLEQVSVTP